LILVVDPGEHYGWALIKGSGSVLEFGHGKARSDHHAQGKVLARLVREYGVDTMVIEGQEKNGQMGRKKFLGIVTLVCRRCVWQHLAEFMYGMDTHVVLPSEWSRALGWRWEKRTVIAKTSGRKRKERVKGSLVRFTEEKYGVRVDTDDEGSAVCIGMYWLSRQEA
jgi:hypothetical protein